jgi:hypothetical protein
MAEEPAKPIRGTQRIALVQDLVSGELTHEALAERYGRSLQAVHQFSARRYVSCDGPLRAVPTTK